MVKQRKVQWAQEDMYKMELNFPPWFSRVSSPFSMKMSTPRVRPFLACPTGQNERS